MKLTNGYIVTKHSCPQCGRDYQSYALPESVNLEVVLQAMADGLITDNTCSECNSSQMRELLKAYPR